MTNTDPKPHEAESNPLFPLGLAALRKLQDRLARAEDPSKTKVRLPSDA